MKYAPQRITVQCEPGTDYEDVIEILVRAGYELEGIQPKTRHMKVTVLKFTRPLRN